MKSYSFAYIMEQLSLGGGSIIIKHQTVWVLMALPLFVHCLHKLFGLDKLSANFTQIVCLFYIYLVNTNCIHVNYVIGICLGQVIGLYVTSIMDRVEAPWLYLFILLVVPVHTIYRRVESITVPLPPPSPPHSDLDCIHVQPVPITKDVSLMDCF